MAVDDLHPDLTVTRRAPEPEPEPSFPGFDPVAVLDGLGAVWSPDFDAYASGEVGAHQVRCALCETCPCSCPEFGTAEHFALVDRRHGRRT